ncbi:hypothetical protein K0M31_018477, partial [Melipona bicolor]
MARRRRAARREKWRVGIYHPQIRRVCTERREAEARLEKREREREAKMERERLEKQRAAEQAVHKHFEESLRLAQQKLKSRQFKYLTAGLDYASNVQGRRLGNSENLAATCLHRHSAEVAADFR